jgi:hypothetical protein
MLTICPDNHRRYSQKGRQYEKKKKKKKGDGEEENYYP